MCKMAWKLGKNNNGVRERVVGPCWTGEDEQGRRGEGRGKAPQLPS
jgi:hypothetical protein